MEEFLRYSPSVRRDESARLTRKRACSPTRCAARPPTISGPHAYSPDRPRHRSGAARPRWRGRRLLLRPGQAGPDRPRGEGQRRPDRGDDARRRPSSKLSATLLEPLDRPVKVRYQGPHLHADSEGGRDRDRHPRLGRQGDAALAGGRHVLAHVAQPARRVAQHRARGRGELQPARDRQAGQARAQVDRPPAGGREGRPQRGQGRADPVPDRPAGQVQHAGQAGRADPARSGQHGDGQGPDQRRPAEGLHQAARPEVSGGADRRPRAISS